MIAVADCLSGRGSAEMARDFYHQLQTHRRVLVQGCHGCERVQFPPTLLCPACHCGRLAWVDGGDSGAVATWVPVFAEEPTQAYSLPKWLTQSIPYASLFVRLTRYPQVRVPALMFDGNLDALRVGVPVRLVVSEGSRPVYLGELQGPESSRDDE